MTGRVLVVDDSLTIRMDLLSAFDAAGIAMHGCATVREARDALAVEAFPVILLDVLLPDGNGVDLLRDIRADARLRGQFVIMLSTEAEVRDRLRGLATGADEYIAKPYDSAAIVGRVRSVMRPAAARSPAGPRQTTVLVVDDSATIRAVLSETLRDAGYEVLTAASGESGLEVAASAGPDAIVVDGALPGIDGATMIQRIRLDAALRATPCVLLTGSDSADGELRALDGGADAFVRKEADFDVLLARLAAVLRSAPSSGRRGTAPLRPSVSRVLAIDDSATYLGEILSVLREDGYDAVGARSGEEALDLLAIQRVDCILCDVQMPGLGGHETCARIKSDPTLSETPLVMLTGFDDRDAMVRALAAGADDYIAKTSEWEVLRARVRAQIRRRRIESDARRIVVEREREAAEARGARELAEARAALADALERKNKELEAFSYSVSHDLRAPLRRIDGFSAMLVEDHASALNEEARDLLHRIRAAVVRMDELIGDLLALSRATSATLHPTDVDVSVLATTALSDLQRRDPKRDVVVAIEHGIRVRGDARLIQVVVENLVGNAWKYSSGRPRAHIWVAADPMSPGTAFTVRDDGAGFDMAFAERLFRPFSRLHSDEDFEGTGIGLATVARIVERHGGEVQAQGQPGLGATFRVFLPLDSRNPIPVLRGSDAAMQEEQT